MIFCKGLQRLGVLNQYTLGRLLQHVAPADPALVHVFQHLNQRLQNASQELVQVGCLLGLVEDFAFLLFLLWPVLVFTTTAPPPLTLASCLCRRSQMTEIFGDTRLARIDGARCLEVGV